MQIHEITGKHFEKRKKTTIYGNQKNSKSQMQAR